MHQLLIALYRKTYGNYTIAMKLMTYNILNGGENGLENIVKVVRDEEPDFLTINEANAFDTNQNKILKWFAEKAGFRYYEIALSGKAEYHVVVFSKYKWEKTTQITPLTRSCIVTEFKTSAGRLSIASTHLTPFKEVERIPEINRILSYNKGIQNRILMGDLNSLSKIDGYKDEMITGFNEMQINKFTANGKLCFDAIDVITSNGFVDPAVILKQNTIQTAPTAINEKSAHTNMRLDYIFVSQPLISFVKSYRVIKNATSETASDHYPIVLECKVDMLEK